MTGEQKDRELRTYLAADRDASERPMHTVRIDRVTGKPATPYTPPEDCMDIPAGPPLHEPTDRDADNVPSQLISSAMSRVAQHDASDLNAIANAVQDVLGFTVWSKRYAIAVLALEALRGPEPTEEETT